MSDLLGLLTGAQKTIQAAIVANVLAILNSRQGSLVHMMNYGFPEYHIHQQGHRAKNMFMHALKQVIEYYEPRIQSVSISEVAAQRHDCILQVKLHAVLTENLETNSLVFDAMVLSGGQVLAVGHPDD